MSSTAIDLLKKSELQTTVTTEGDFDYSGADPLLLTRIGVDPDMPSYFEEALRLFRMSAQGFVVSTASPTLRLSPASVKAG
jgi:hypothetical protein